jgi:hypothetical protein
MQSGTAASSQQQQEEEWVLVDNPSTVAHFYEEIQPWAAASSQQDEEEEEWVMINDPSMGAKVLTEDQIWRAALRVWEEIPCAKITSAHVQAQQFSTRIVKMGVRASL